MDLIHVFRFRQIGEIYAEARDRSSGSRPVHAGYLIWFLIAINDVAELRHGKVAGQIRLFVVIMLLVINITIAEDFWF